MFDGLTKMAISATLHCLTGCAIGEVLGAVIGSALGWHNFATTALAIVLAFCFGYALTMRSLLRSKLTLRQSARIALASDTLSITTMEIVDTLILLLIPGALMAGPTTAEFWLTLILALFVAFLAAVPVNRYLLARGKGHALAHGHHHQK